MKKLNYLEGLRGLAALIVVLHHLVLMFYPVLNYGEERNSISKYIAISPLNIFYNGDFAVCLFFVLSGYVLSYKYVLTKKPQLLVGYTIKRYFRLLPLIVLSIIVGFTFVKLNLINVEKLNDVTQSGNWLLDLFKCNQTINNIIQNCIYGVLFLGDNQYNPVVWSMKIEFIGSMFLFVFLLLNHKIKRKWILFVLAFCTIFYYQQFYYLSFLIGYALCYFIENKLIIITSTLFKLFLLLITIMLCSYPAAWQYVDISIYKYLHIFSIDLYSFYHVIGATLLLFLITQHQMAINFLSKKYILFFGKISFSMYLLHLIILVSFTIFLFLNLLIYFNYHISFIVSVIISFPLIIFMSNFATTYIDKPALQLANKLESNFLLLLFKRK